jgi:hypothetical protein
LSCLVSKNRRRIKEEDSKSKSKSKSIAKAKGTGQKTKADDASMISNALFQVSHVTLAL